MEEKETEIRIRFCVAAEAAPTRIDRVLSDYCKSQQQFSFLTRSQIQQLIAQGAVAINGKVCVRPAVSVRAGDEIDILLVSRLPGAEIEPYEFPLSILYEDSSLIVIDKPAGISMHPGAGNRTKTLVHALVAHFRGKHDGSVQAKLPEVYSEGGERPGIVHRLDKDTSGVIVVAKTLAALQSLSQQFAGRTIVRSYLALLYVPMKSRSVIKREDAGVIETYIARHPTRRKEFCVSPERGRRAKTEWIIRRRIPYACVAQLKLHTGRTHQIRVHLAHLGCPVLGDAVYGKFDALPPELLSAHRAIGRQALHAESLEFSHPTSGERLCFRAPVPQDIVALQNAFEHYGGA